MNFNSKFLIMPVVFVFSILLILPFQSHGLETLDFPGQVEFSIKLPENWIYEKNLLYDGTGWIVSLYDGEDWSIATDISQYKNPSSLNNISDDEIIETSFLSYYYVCQDDVYDKISLDKLDSQLQNLLNYHYQKELSEFITDSEDIYEWYFYLSEAELKDYFEPKTLDQNAPVLSSVPLITDYMTGTLCTDFVPIDYEIFDDDDFTRYQIFYTWKENFVDGTYYEHFATADDLWIKTNTASYVISLNTKSAYSEFDRHVQYVDDIINSIEISQIQKITEPKIPADSKLLVGQWSNNLVSDVEMYLEIEYYVNNNVMIRPSFLSNMHNIEIISIPSWLKNSSLWYYEQVISEEQFLQILNYVIEKGIIKYNIVDK
jgi:hypothetical protein